MIYSKNNSKSVFRLSLVRRLVAVLLMLLPLLAGAQIPALLPGRWEVRQISFVTDQTVPPDVMARMDNPEVAELNQDIAAGTAHLLVEFRPDGTYQFTVMHEGQPPHTEVGTYFVKNGTLFAQVAEVDGISSFNNQVLVQLTRRKLLVEFLVGDDLPGVAEQIEYRRVQ